MNISLPGACIVPYTSWNVEIMILEQQDKVICQRHLVDLILLEVGTEVGIELQVTRPGTVIPIKEKNKLNIINTTLTG